MRLSYSILLYVLFLLNTEKASALEIYCPSDVWVNCNAEIWDLSIYGNAYYIKNGYQYDAGTPSVVYDLTTCNTGVIYRTWSVEDQYWNIISCTQTIHVSGGNFNSSHIYWPHQELHLFGCSTSTHPNSLPYGYGYPEYAYVSCSHIGTSFKDQVFVFGPDCKKILRKWTIIDWCNYFPNSPYQNQGIFTFTQIIKVSNTDTPILSCPKKIEVDATECDSMYVNTPPVSVDGMSCTGEYGIYNNSYYADAGRADASGKYPIGTTVVDYLVEYACGQEKVCRTEIVVKDKKPAVPYCYATLSVALMPQDTDQDGNIDDGMVEVWAKDLDVNSYHPCNNGPLSFTFSSDLTDTYRIFTCEEVGPNVMQMWVTDIKGNQSYCIVTIDVQNNAAAIPDCEYVENGNKYALHGRVTDEENNTLENVDVYVKDKNAIYDYEMDYDTINAFAIVDSFYNQSEVLVYVYEMTTTILEVAVDSTPFHNVMYLETNKNGIYGSNNVLYYRDYKINAYKDGDMTRVSYSDLELLEDHVNGTALFENPYSYLAADINEDEIIDVEDVVLLSALIEGEEDEWPNERQWVFFNKEDMARMTDQPLDDGLAQIVEIDYFEDGGHQLDFVGILKGDIDKHENSNIEDTGRIELRSGSKYDKENIRVFPNPFTSVIHFSLPQEESYLLQIFDTKGTLILERRLESDNAEIIIDESAEWETGNYMYQLISDMEVKSGKIMKI